MSDRPPSKAQGGNEKDTPSSSSSTLKDSGTSSFMSQFYTPMNPTYITSQSQTSASQAQPSHATYTQQTTHSQYTQYQPSPAAAVTTVQPNSNTSLMGAGAALILANLTTLPGFLSEAAIQEARQEYLGQQQFGHNSAQAIHSHPSPHSSHLPLSSSSSHPYSNPQSYHYQPSTSTGNPSTDPHTAIDSLLKELQQSQSTSSNTSSPSSASPVPHTISPLNLQPQPSQSSQPLESTSAAAAPVTLEDFSTGKITPQLLKALASVAEADTQQGGLLLDEIKRLKEKQLNIERSLHKDRQALLEKHKKELVRLQANEIMGINIKHELQQTKMNHSEELKQFDKNVIRTLDKEIKRVQESLAKSKVPMMVCTTDPVKIAAQIRVLRLLEDMLLQTE
ncbi:hypothetical protein BX616_004889 [Lobosporangium transversale]|uniref:Uncharacterized protein n=1 Tax=Lobosporangium transversale TaxID=64571 RepID=A0A1Y2GC52_9FUNG|nr:hypothetical protein BCR41DRAFT_426120 [Lobosporangium transversale]KAF9897846.1 hypothetical protein BX616_004889 [Lobosporangium transversale]ORZ02017.1 hypothetical protein BCR41DRAFT_426120 [Lobosporangium transversale]|eukprot:XP_021876245.1 hypothetical protein BCR41DRAFT_426120 [Lobosporangium transversale]